MSSARTASGEARRTRRGGRPTLAEAAQLDEEVRRRALELFLERGFEGTSMDAIAAAAGTTKASLYARFPGKDDVFRSVLQWAIDRTDWPEPEPEPPDLDDLDGALHAIAEAAVRRALNPTMVQLSRIAVAQASRFPDLAQRTAANAGSARRQLVAELLRRHAATGAIRADEPELLAELFIGLVSGIPARYASVGTVLDPEVQQHHTDVAVELFLRSLRP